SLYGTGRYRPSAMKSRTCGTLLDVFSVTLHSRCGSVEIRRCTLQPPGPCRVPSSAQCDHNVECRRGRAPVIKHVVDNEANRLLRSPGSRRGGLEETQGRAGTRYDPDRRPSMDLSRMPRTRALDVPGRSTRSAPYPTHALGRDGAMPRRQFFRTAAGVASAGAILGVGLQRPGLAWAQGSHQPIPIPGGSPAIQELAGQLFHIFGPGPEGLEGALDPVDAEPSSITDFSGAIGLAYLNGMVTRTNRVTGEVRALPFVNTDMRFMKGVFRGADGQIHQGAFAFV